MSTVSVTCADGSRAEPMISCALMVRPWLDARPTDRSHIEQVETRRVVDTHRQRTHRQVGRCEFGRFPRPQNGSIESIAARTVSVMVITPCRHAQFLWVALGGNEWFSGMALQLAAARVCHLWLAMGERRDHWLLGSRVKSDHVCPDAPGTCLCFPYCCQTPLPTYEPPENDGDGHSAEPNAADTAGCD